MHHLAHLFALGVVQVLKLDDLLPDASVNLSKFADAKRESIIDYLHTGGVISARTHATINTHTHRIAIE